MDDFAHAPLKTYNNLHVSSILLQDGMRAFTQGACLTSSEDGREGRATPRTICMGFTYKPESASECESPYNQNRIGFTYKPQSVSKNKQPQDP